MSRRAADLADDIQRLAERMDGALPQTQCTRCGYTDCAAYARAVAAGKAMINQCPPGGEQGVARLAHITGQPAQPLNPLHGQEGPRMLAVIDENWCIGCTLCIKACPTDAVLGSNKRMHTVISQWCTGCELCVAVCPVDCIALQNTSGERTGWAAWSEEDAQWARQRYAWRQRRLAREKHENEQRLQAREPERAQQLESPPACLCHTGPEAPDKKRAVIEAVLARARTRRPPKN